MMTNLFSIFDPSTSNFLSLNWLSIPMMALFFPLQYWLLPSRWNFMWMSFFQYMYTEFKILIPYSYSNLILFLSTLYLILFNNFLGLFPYIFTASSHMSFCLSLSLTLWLGTMLYSIFNYFNDFMSHLTPQGTPGPLMPFMVMIETTSLMIRPLTLAIRLTANMVAGHLLLSLLGNSGPSISTHLLLISMLFSQILLFMLEIAVSLIQAYVFSILSTLYSSEA